MFLNYCTNILVVGFVYFLSDFSRSRSSDLKAFCKKNILKRFQNSKHLCQSLLLKLQNVLKNRFWHRSFFVNFTKFLRNVLQELCFVQLLQRFAPEIAKSQATSSLFIKESVVFNCLSIKSNKTWYFLFHLPLIYFKILPKHIFDYTLFQKKNKQGGIQYTEFEGVLKKATRNSRIN